MEIKNSNFIRYKNKFGKDVAEYIFFGTITEYDFMDNTIKHTIENKVELYKNINKNYEDFIKEILEMKENGRVSGEYVDEVCRKFNAYKENDMKETLVYLSKKIEYTHGISFGWALKSEIVKSEEKITMIYIY